LFPTIAGMGIKGIEVAPSRIWTDTWKGLSPDQVSMYRREIESSGLRVVGLHSLFFDQPELGLFKPETRAATLDFLVHLSSVCRDLGGRTLVWGSGRRRGNVSKQEAIDQSLRFLSELCARVEPHGTCFCFEPLGPKDSDFINSAFEAISIASRLDHPAFAVQLDAKALFENGEDNLDTFVAAKSRLIHFHANQPGLGHLGQGPVNHQKMGEFLRQISYDGFISIEQRLLSESDPISDIRRSVSVLKECYL
jgi:sugar phosphate isomerase/epimerase